MSERIRLSGAGWLRSLSPRRKPPTFNYFRTSREVIRLAVMMYERLPLSLRNVENPLHERGIDVCRDFVWFWWNRFGPVFAAEIRKKRMECKGGCRTTLLLVQPMQDFSEGPLGILFMRKVAQIGKFDHVELCVFLGYVLRNAWPHGAIIGSAEK